MCLDRVNKVSTLRQCGYAYKVVRPSPYIEGDYFGKWPSFNVGGGGGTGNNLRGVRIKGTLRNGVTWKIDREDLDVKLHLVNLGMEKRNLIRYAIDYNTKGRGQYRLKRLIGLYWVEATEWMSMTALWYFLDGMLTLMIKQGD